MNLILFYSIVGVAGALVGSFINMAAYRIVKQLYFNWYLECYNFLELKPKFNCIPSLGLNLFYPRSHCPLCKKTIYFFDNIPIISYLILKFKCRNCKQHISCSYLVIEIITLISSLIVSYKFGFNYKVIFGLLLTWVLILQSLIDFKENIIPDEITLPMLWLGLIINYFSVFESLSNAMFGAVGGYLIFWLIYWVFKLITGKEGLGYGDFKLLAMLGAWLGATKLLFIILTASILGSLVGLIIIIWYKRDYNKPFCFGPYLGFGGWLALLLGNSIDLLDLQFFKFL